MTRAIVLLSGGQDSTTCLYWALKRFSKVLAVGFDYGQKHKRELEQAATIADTANVEYKIFNVKGAVGESSLTNYISDHNKPHAQNENLPGSFTAGRNALFLTVAASYAYGLGIDKIVTGVCQTDFSGYPDCRREFIDAMEVSLSLAMDKPLTIYTPLMYLTKAETWKLASELGVAEIIRRDTLTDYNGSDMMNEWGMGELNNPASVLRAKGYFEAKEKGWV